MAKIDLNYLKQADVYAFLMTAFRILSSQEHLVNSGLSFFYLDNSASSPCFRINDFWKNSIHVNNLYHVLAECLITTKSLEAISDNLKHILNVTNKIQKTNCSSSRRLAT